MVSLAKFVTDEKLNDDGIKETPRFVANYIYFRPLTR